MKKTFFPTETWDSRWRIDFNFENFILKGEEISFYFTSSYNVPPARLLGFTYTEYLKFCRQNGALLKGKNGYTHPVWGNKEECEMICKLLNKEWDKVAAEFQFIKN